MPIRSITTAADLAPWLPSDYTTATPWDAAQVTSALDAGHHPRLIAAEVWEEWAMAKGAAEAETEGEKVVKSWQNGEVSVEYAIAHAPRHYGLAQARYHRSRAPIRSVNLAARNVAYEEG